MNRNTLNYLVDLCAVVSFLVVFVTGVVKMPGLKNTFMDVLPMSEVSWLHDWVGILLGVLVFIHLLLHWRWVVSTTRRLLDKVNI